jgi:ParB family transcriptional regulator, chromosome partitioning protein
MAKRRKLEAPSADDMTRFEEEFRRETPARSAAAPIAQVAADTAQAYEAGTAEDRAARARDATEAQKFRDADAAGLLIFQIPLDAIEPLSMQRDRTVIDKDAMAELEHSISQNGIRMPIEVYALKRDDAGKQYGLLSGYRRLIAQQNLYARTGDVKYKTIKAVLREPDQMGGAFVAMVEENEIRQDLSHYERGRIAVIAAQQGAFATTEDAVAQMFAAASKAKRSKIRSFAMIFEELGDMLDFPETMREKDGLRLAAALRSGAETRLREVLGTGQGVDAKSEWALIERVIAEQTATETAATKGGRPKSTPSAPGWSKGETVSTSAGVTLRKGADGQGYLIHFSGDGVSADLMDSILQDIRDRLDKG